MTKKRLARSLARSRARNRQPRKIILIVVEGKETEVNYFKDLKKALKLTGVSVEIVPSKNSDPLGVVEHAICLYQQSVKEEKNGTGLKFEEVFCVIDRDHPDADYKKATSLAAKNKFRFIYSIPCFEIWFLLHFTASTKPHSICESLIRELIIYIPDYQKNMNVFKLICDKCDIAIKNAKFLEKYHGSDKSNDCPNPSTK